MRGYRREFENFYQDFDAAHARKKTVEYNERFYRYMNVAAMGAKRGRFSSYMNIYSGLDAYEILREQGLNEEQAVAVYDRMCAAMRRLATCLYKFVDALPMATVWCANRYWMICKVKRQFVGILLYCRMMMLVSPMKSADASTLTPVKRMAIRNFARFSVTMIGMPLER